MPADIEHTGREVQGGSFACPECGDSVAMKGRVPGRQILCGSCGTLVEVPFLQRIAPKPKRRRRRIPPVILAVAGIAVLMSVAIIATKQALRSRERDGQQAAMATYAQQIADSVQAERPAEIIAACDAALARTDLPWEDSRKSEFENLRRGAMRRQAEQVQDELRDGRAAGPGAFAETLAILDRLENEPGFEDESARLREATTVAVRAHLDADIQSAEAAIEDGEAVKALDTIVGLLRKAEALPSWATGPLPSRAREQARRVACRFGAAVAPIDAKLWLGSLPGYEQSARPVLIAALRQKGYAAEPDEPSLAVAWKECAPYRAALHVEEQPDEVYLQSANKTTRIEAFVTLARPGEPEWKQRILAKTAVPLPHLRAYEASRLSVGTKPNTEAQQMLYDNAFRSIIDQLARSTRTLPDRPTTAP